MTTTPATTRLPTIVAFTGMSDAGEFGAALCPHCDAKGRYTKWFVCSDGTRRGAMAGCIQKFPVSPLAAEQQKIMDRQKDKARDGGKLASWDEAKLEAIEAVIAGQMGEDEALTIVRNENLKRQVWLDRRYKRGRR